MRIGPYLFKQKARTALKGKWQDALVHGVRDHHVYRKKNEEHAYKQRACRPEQHDGAHDARDGGDERVHHHVDQPHIPAHEAAGLADEASAKAAGVEGHRLVGERVKAQARKVVVAIHFELHHGPVLQL